MHDEPQPESPLTLTLTMLVDAYESIKSDVVKIYTEPPLVASSITVVIAIASLASEPDDPYSRTCSKAESPALNADLTLYKHETRVEHADPHTLPPCVTLDVAT
jgi:hypothetical protein